MCDESLCVDVCRFGISLAELGEVVPSSNPASQDSVRSDEALWLQREEREAGHPEWSDSFSPADINSACFSCQGQHRHS